MMGYAIIVNMNKRSLALVGCLLVLFGCGKVAQDMTPTSNDALFLSTDFNVLLDQNPQFLLDITSKNVTKLYANYQGITLNKGIEKIGWASAELISRWDETVSKNVIDQTNYDPRKNTVVTPRYLQGIIGLDAVVTRNDAIHTSFNTLKPNYDYYVLSQFTDKNNYVMHVSNKIATTSVTITPYQSLLAVLVMTHLRDVSYESDSIIPTHMFETIIPTGMVSVGIHPTNNVTSFSVVNPVFEFDDPRVTALIQLMQLVTHSDKAESLDFIDNHSDDVFSEQMKVRLKASVTAYFEPNIPTGNVN